MKLASAVANHESKVQVWVFVTLLPGSQVKGKGHGKGRKKNEDLAQMISIHSG